MQTSNKERVRTFFAAAAANDSEAMLAVLHPDLKIIEAESLPFGGVTEGRENFKEFTKKVFTTWNNTSIISEELIEDGNRVVVLASMSAQSKSSGTRFTMQIAEIWTFDADGLAVEIKPFYFDTKRLVDLFNGDA
ncbi:MAG: ketosteroid isomerase-like protein [Halieaceae bacterium]|jgi:ketosteroid isomerase-like protein